MNQRGENRRMIQSNQEDYAHFFQSIKGYGVFWDNYSPTALNDDGRTLKLESEVGELVDYYFIYGGDADGVISGMRWLTGKVPMLPLQVSCWMWLIPIRKRVFLSTASFRTGSIGVATMCGMPWSLATRSLPIIRK